MKSLSFIRKYILFLILLIFVSISFIAIIECTLIMKRGFPPINEPGNAQFKDQYQEIYNRLFKKTKLANGTLVYVSQRKYLSESFSVYKRKNTKRVFIVGGSVARSLSSQTYGAYLKKLLENAIPGKNFEVISYGIGGYDSYRESLIHREVVKYYKPDFIVLMSGNNEFYNPVRINLLVYRLNRLLSRLWVFRDLQKRFPLHIKTNTAHKTFLTNFKDNLQSMTRLSKNKHIPMFLCTLPVNFSDCPPQGSIMYKDNEFLLAWDALNKNRFEDAIKKFEHFLISHPNDAFGHYFLAQSHDASGQYAKAQKHYFEALELDSPGDRCSPSRNKIIRQLCAQEKQVCVDLEKTFIHSAPNGLLGKELFTDNCHWWPVYYELVCEEIAQSIISYREPNDIQSPSTLSETESAPINKVGRVFEIIPTTLNEDSNLKKLINFAFSKCHDSSINERTISFLKTVYLRKPYLLKSRDVLREDILSECRNNEWLQDTLLPRFDEIWFIFLSNLGEMYYRVGEYQEAIECFSELININSDFWYSYLGRSIAYYEIGQIDKSQSDFEKVDIQFCELPLIKFYAKKMGFVRNDKNSNKQILNK